LRIAEDKEATWLKNSKRLTDHFFLFSTVKKGFLRNDVVISIIRSFGFGVAPGNNLVEGKRLEERRKGGWVGSRK